MCNVKYIIREKWFNGHIVANGDTINYSFQIITCTSIFLLGVTSMFFGQEQWCKIQNPLLNHLIFKKYENILDDNMKQNVNVVICSGFWNLFTNVRENLIYYECIKNWWLWLVHRINTALYMIHGMHVIWQFI